MSRIPRVTDPRKRSLYLPDRMVEEVRAEAERLERSWSWVIQQAWRLSRERIRAMPDHHLVVP